MRLRTDGSSSEAVMNGGWVRRVVARGVDIAEVSRCGTLYTGTRSLCPEKC